MCPYISLRMVRKFGEIMHYFAVSHHASKSLPCHSDIDGARMDILNELNVGLQAYMERGDVYDILEVTDAMNDATTLESVDSYSGSYASLGTVSFRARSWHIEVCNNITCTDSADGVFDW